MFHGEVGWPLSSQKLSLFAGEAYLSDDRICFRILGSLLLCHRCGTRNVPQKSNSLISFTFYWSPSETLMVRSLDNIFALSRELGAFLLLLLEKSHTRVSRQSSLHPRVQCGHVTAPSDSYWRPIPGEMAERTFALSWSALHCREACPTEWSLHTCADTNTFPSSIRYS